MFRQFVKGGFMRRNPRYGVLENNKKEEGRYGGVIEPRFKCWVKGEWRGIFDLRLMIFDSTRFAQVPREKRVDFKKKFGTIIPNFGMKRVLKRIVNSE